MAPLIWLTIRLPTLAKRSTPTPEPIGTLNAQLNALAAGTKPGMLLAPCEPMPDALPEGIQAAEIPGRRTLLYRDDATVRERSLIISVGDKKYVTVPMPLGFHAIPNIGRISTEFAMGGFKKPVDHTLRLAEVFAEAFNPIGSAGFSIQTIAPTAIDPLVELSENKD